MDKLIPLEVSIHHHQQELKRQKQREELKQKLVDQQFTGDPATFERGSAFADDYISSAYQQVKPGLPRWITKLMTCLGGSAIRINAIHTS